MSNPCDSQLISEDYADILIDYNQDLRTFEFFRPNCYHIINAKHAVVHFPHEKFSSDFLHSFGYTTIPSCFGLIDSTSLEASGVKRIQNSPNLKLRGQGVLIGIVDTGIDYTNPLFKNADNTTRIVSIWDQTIESENPPSLFPFGTLYTREKINEALSNDDPFSIVPSKDEIGHGTFLAAVAAGNTDANNDFSGVAPEAEFLIVKLKQAKQYLRDFYLIPSDAICYSEIEVLFGLKFLQETSLKMKQPIAFCIGLGTSQGGHDGRDSISDYLSYLSDRNGTAIVSGAGNEGNRGHHYFGTVMNTAEFETVELNVGANEKGFSMELWGPAPNTYSIAIVSPSGEFITRIPARLREHRDVSFIFEKTRITVDYNIVEYETGDELILIRMKDPTPGIWRFQVYAEGDLPLTYHIWLPIEPFLQADTYFLKPNPYTLITSPGTAVGIITITAYDHTTQSIYQYSSRGFARTGFVKPELAAPGVDISGPSSGDGYEVRSGTSIATAHTAGIAALLLEWGIVKEQKLDIDTIEIKKFLIRGAKRDANITYPNQEWGYGIIDIFNTFLSLTNPS